MYTEQSAFIDTYEFLIEHLPNAHGVLMPRTEWGHFGPLEQPEVVGRIIDRLASPDRRAADAMAETGRGA